MIKCGFCGKKDYHYTQNRNTSIGCYEFSYPLERKYVCDECIEKYIIDLKNKNINKCWWPKEIKM